MKGVVLYRDITARSMVECVATVRGEISVDDPRYVTVDTDEIVVLIPHTGVIRIESETDTEGIRS